MSSPTPSHRARKRRKEDERYDKTNRLREQEVVLEAQSQPAFPLQAFLWCARRGVSQWITLPLILIFVGLYRWATGFWSYSGFQKPPMHGDFEAQRHWMELTNHLPVTHWYFHDLEWWGLDYPPLTAYHSWLLGKLGSIFNPQWFALHTSRGLDDPDLKVYMRATVLISEYLIYIPAIVMLCRSIARNELASSWEVSIGLVAILMQPATILIDHAHFQYNTVMLGFVVASIGCMMSKRYAWTCVFFVAALSFKQMALYYAPAVFAYLLGSCVFPRLDPSRFLIIALTTVLSFATVFAPFLIAGLHDSFNDPSKPVLLAPPLLDRLSVHRSSIFHGPLLQITQSIHRIFPVARGLFEDKVANFWCALHTVHKLTRYDSTKLQLASLCLTVGSILPPCIILFLYPTRQTLLFGLATTAFGFFLFSFQVHEKSILLPLLPVTLMLATKSGMQPIRRSWIIWANMLGCWTMFPLLKRDELRIPYFVLTLLWAWLLGLPELTYKRLDGGLIQNAAQAVHDVFYLFMLVWHGLEAFVEPPSGKPDLWVVINACVGAAGFGICYLWCLWELWSEMPLRTTSKTSKQKTK